MPSPINDERHYFAALDIPFFDDPMLARLRHFANQTISQGSHFEHAYSHFDHLQLAEPAPAIPDLVALTDSCLVPAISVMLLLPPRVTMPVHRDTENTSYRQSTITVPLLPVDRYPGTNWYASMGSTEPVATATYEDMKPLLLNIDEYHGNIEIGEEWRCCLQIPLAIPYAQAYEHIKHNRLFTGYDCHLA